MYKLHIPTEQYGFVEVEVDVPLEDLKLTYNEIKRQFDTNTQGIDQKAWNKALDRYLSDNTMEADLYASMSDAQKYVIQEIKKSVKRIAYKDTN